MVTASAILESFIHHPLIRIEQGSVSLLMEWRMRHFPERVKMVEIKKRQPELPSLSLEIN
ncbi:hypothetical protein IE982_14025 [Enterobacter hormaechei]|nr:hypothetical protein [Enterobacter hormaechei]